MKRPIVFSLFLVYILSACNGSSKILDNGCIPPIINFAYPVNEGHSRNTTQILPPIPWQAEALLPEIPPETRAFDLVSIARTKDGYNEIWVKRQIYIEGKNSESVPKVQLMIYRTNSKEWILIPEEFNDKSAKSGSIYVTNDGTIWAYLGFSGYSYFGVYNEKEERFDYVVGSENVPQGNQLLDDDGKFWILANRDGIYSYDTASHKIEKHINMPDLETGSSLYGSMATSAPDGSIYFLNMTGERQVSLMHYIPEIDQLELVPNIDYLGDISYNLFMDRSGRLWFGDLGWMEPDGIWYRIVRSPVFITDRAESSEKYIWAYPSIVFESSNHLLWFQSDNGMTWLDPKEGKWCWFTTEQSNIVEDQQHNLWMIADGKLYKRPLTP